MTMLDHPLPPRADGRKRPRRVQKKIDRRAGAMRYSGHLACALARLLAAIEVKTARAEGGTLGRVVDPCQAEPMGRIVERVTDHGVITEFERAPVIR